MDEPAAGRARLRDRFGGPDGNERLTAVTGFVLIVLLFGEGLTLLQLRQHLSWHIGLGLALIPPIGLKLASVGWRFARYYLGRRAYVEKGPPNVALRLMGPLLVVATVALLATGVGLIVIGPGRGLMLNLHKASFLLWLWLTGAHVLLHLRGALSATGRELRRGAHRVAGGPLRRYALLAALVAGLVVGLATIPAQTPWLNWVRTHQSHEDGRG
ncbi:MAG: hypothetical protein ACXVY3_10210 [Gaiellaceae bacterium]